jgi:hypothetical protein
LATDSRATSDTGRSDDAQKAFAIGRSTERVIAGLIGSDVSLEGFRLRDAMATKLTQLSETVNRLHESPSAMESREGFNPEGMLLPVC